MPRKRSRGGKRRVDTTASFVSSFSSVLVEPPALVGESARCFTAPILLCDDDVSDDDEDICVRCSRQDSLSSLVFFRRSFWFGRVEKKRAVVNVVFRTVFRLDTHPRKLLKERESIHFFPGVRFTDSLSPTFQIAPCPCLWTRTVVKSPSPFPPQTKKKKQKKTQKIGRFW